MMTTMIKLLFMEMMILIIFVKFMKAIIISLKVTLKIKMVMHTSFIHFTKIIVLFSLKMNSLATSKKMDTQKLKFDCNNKLDFQIMSDYLEKINEQLKREDLYLDSFLLSFDENGKVIINGKINFRKILCDNYTKIECSFHDYLIYSFLDKNGEFLFVKYEDYNYCDVPVIEMMIECDNGKSISLNSPWFEHVKCGRKRYEGRRNKNINFKKGDLLKVKHYVKDNEKPFYVIVDDIIHFKTFREALENLPIDEVLPDVKNVDDGVNIYYKYVSQATQEKDGVVMIKISPF